MVDLVSVIIPIYNAEDYLNECIDSLLNQTYSSIEIILVNDGSTDNSLQIAEGYAKQYPQVKLFNKSNGGQSTARNLGIEKAKGSYFIFVDSDDYVTATHIEELYEALKKYDVKVSMCRFTKEATELSSKISLQTNLLSGNFSELIAKLYSSTYPAVAPCAKLYDRLLFETVKFHEGIIYEDGILFYEIVDQIKAIALVDSKSYYYRTTENSTLTSRISQKNFDVLEKNTITEKFFLEKHPEDMRHFYQKALNLNDSVALKCIQDKGNLAKELFGKLYKQNRVYSRDIFPRKLIYLSKVIYTPFIWVMSKIYAQNLTGKETWVKKTIGKIVK